MMINNIPQTECVVFAEKSIDSHGSFDRGIFTVPISGRYAWINESNKLIISNLKAGEKIVTKNIIKDSCDIFFNAFVKKYLTEEDGK